MVSESSMVPPGLPGNKTNRYCPSIAVISFYRRNATKCSCFAEAIPPHIAYTGPSQQLRDTTDDLNATDIRTLQRLIVQERCFIKTFGALHKIGRLIKDMLEIFTH